MSMKKMLSVLLAGAMAISLAACGSKTPNPPEVTPNTPSGPSSASTPEGPTDDGVWRPFNEKGEIVTNGGRVLGITATGADLKEARGNAYAAAEWIAFDNKYMRHDIGKAIDEA